MLLYCHANLCMFVYVCCAYLSSIVMFTSASFLTALGLLWSASSSLPCGQLGYRNPIIICLQGWLLWCDTALVADLALNVNSSCFFLSSVAILRQGIYPFCYLCVICICVESRIFFHLSIYTTCSCSGSGNISIQSPASLQSYPLAFMWIIFFLLAMYLRAGLGLSFVSF